MSRSALQANRVAVVREEPARYCAEAPYHPSERYPEYPFPDLPDASPNPAYSGVRRLFHLLGLDEEHWGSRLWNPLGDIVEPGMTVVLKPNFVLSRHRTGGDRWSIVTHPSVLRAIADYCLIALRGSGRIIVADAPQYDCDFGELARAGGFDRLCELYGRQPGVHFEFRDLRSYWSRGRHFPSMALGLPGDPEGSVLADLDGASALSGKDPSRLYGAVYHRHELAAHHSGGRHEYQVAGTVLNADVVISVPKLKVHKKVGVTLNLKGLVGASTNKNLLVHYTLTPPSRGGDQYPDGHFTASEEALIRLERWMYDNLLARRSVPLEYVHRSAYWLHHRLIKPLGLKVDPEKRLLDAGNWHGNDSAWRMSLDLFRILGFADRKGCIQATPQRRLFSVVDGIVGGEGNGPLTPSARQAGILIAGHNLLAVDLVSTRLMGFDPLKLRLYLNALADPYFHHGVRHLDDVEVVSEESVWRGSLQDRTSSYLAFQPHPGWVGHVEMQSEVQR